MRIAYGIHGYGRGHAMRALAVLPQLAARHDLLILAGGDAYLALQPAYPVLRIPTLQYYYDHEGRLSRWRTFTRTLPALTDLAVAGPALQMVMDALEHFRPDVVVSDSEAYTHRAARRLKIPRISFDNFGVLVYCRPPLRGLDRLKAWAQAQVYRALFGEPDRAIVANFMAIPSPRKDVQVVGAVIREEVRRVTPTRGEHLLVYMSKGEHEYTPQIERALAGLDCPVRIYGVPRTGKQGNLEYKPAANEPFIHDLASCRAVFGTTGNQLLGEVIYFGKPMLGMPIDCLEQRMNAARMESMGVGLQVPRHRVSTEVIRDFLAREGEFIAKVDRPEVDGASEAVAAIERFAAEQLEKEEELR